MGIKARAITLDWNKFKSDARAAYDADVVKTEAELRVNLERAVAAKFGRTIMDWQGGANEPPVTKGYKKTDPVEVPKFPINVKSTSIPIVLEFTTDNWLWIRLDEGVHHVVTAEREVFQPMDKPRTIPGTLHVERTGAYSGRLVTMVQGSTYDIEARGWLDLIAKELTDTFTSIYAAAGLKFSAEVIRN